VIIPPLRQREKSKVLRFKRLRFGTGDSCSLQLFLQPCVSHYTWRYGVLVEEEFLIGSFFLGFLVSFNSHPKGALSQVEGRRIKEPSAPCGFIYW